MNNQLNELRGTIDYFIATGSIFAKDLVEIERKMVDAMLSGMPIEKGNTLQDSDPWYPDDSGQWVEVTGGIVPDCLDHKTIVEVLLWYERDDQEWRQEARQVSTWNWENIVAYKKV